jgi:hypothetical protein
MSQNETPYTTASRIKSIEETDLTEGSKCRRWADEITMAEKELDNFHKQGRTTVRRYKDQRDSVDGAQRKFNIFSTNVGILQSSLYSKIPKVNVERRFNQSADDPARVASLILENAVMQDIDEPECDFDQVMKDAIEDRLVPGMGCAWLRLETDTEEKTLEAQWDSLTGDKVQEASTYETITRQEVVIDHVFWEDFLYSPCRTWKERRWIARRVYLDRDALVKRFGEDIGKTLPLDYNPRANLSAGQSNEPLNDVLQKAVVYEIWDRQKKKVIWFSRGHPTLLDERDDPLNLEDFEPCPKPLFALTTTSNCVAVNDFVMAQDQYNEMDQVNNRISLLVEACKVVGVYDASATGIQRMLQQGSENTMVPVDSWAMFAEKGGVKGAVDWLPLDMVIQALERLRQAREDIKGQIYELTGIADIVRGSSKASETLGAQQLKSEYAGLRISKLKQQVALFAQQILSIKAEILCKHVTPEQLIKMSNLQYYPDAQNDPLVQQAIELLKGNHESFEWRVKIQADTMAEGDYTVQKAEAVEFTNAVATYLQSAATTLKAVPDSAPILFETLKFALSRFRGAKELEGVIDSTLATIMQKIQNPPPAPPDPAIQKAQVEAQVAVQKAQLDSQAKQQDMQIKMKEAELEMATKAQELRFKQAEHQQSTQQDEVKFMQSIAQSEQKARHQMVLDAQQAKEKSDE